MWNAELGLETINWLIKQHHLLLKHKELLIYKRIGLNPAKLKPELHSNCSFTTENIKDHKMIFFGDSS